MEPTPGSLEPYNDAWPAAFAEAAEQLSATLGATWLIEHIGSTSVPGLLARPIIDLAVRIPRGESVRTKHRELVLAGWNPVEGGPRNHAVRVKIRDGRRTHIAHFFATRTWHTTQQRLFADWLRRHEDDRERYAALKLRLVADGLRGADYTAAKTEFVQEVLDRARAQRGVGIRDVWEK